MSVRRREERMKCSCFVTLESLFAEPDSKAQRTSRGPPGRRLPTSGLTSWKSHGGVCERRQQWCVAVTAPQRPLQSTWRAAARTLTTCHTQTNTTAVYTNHRYDEEQRRGRRPAPGSAAVAAPPGRAGGRCSRCSCPRAAPLPPSRVQRQAGRRSCSRFHLPEVRLITPEPRRVTAAVGVALGGSEAFPPAPLRCVAARGAGGGREGRRVLAGPQTTSLKTSIWIDRAAQQVGPV